MSFATAEEAAAADFARPERRVTAFGAAGETLAALAFDSTDGGFWVRPAGSETVFHLYTWKVNELAPQDSTLRTDGGD